MIKMFPIALINLQIIFKINSNTKYALNILPRTKKLLHLVTLPPWYIKVLQDDLAITCLPVEKAIIKFLRDWFLFNYKLLLTLLLFAIFCTIYHPFEAVFCPRQKRLTGWWKLWMKNNQIEHKLLLNEKILKKSLSKVTLFFIIFHH